MDARQYLKARGWLFIPRTEDIDESCRHSFPSDKP
jgi:hypothetical protein